MRTRIISISLILTLLTIGVFGFLALSLLDHGYHYSCPFSLGTGTNCLQEHKGWMVAFHHVDGLQNLTMGIILLIVLLFLVFTGLIPETFSSKPPSFQKYQARKESIFKSIEQFLRWFSLHEKRDPLALILGA